MVETKMLEELLSEIRASDVAHYHDTNECAQENMWSLFITERDFQNFQNLELSHFFNQVVQIFKGKWNSEFVFYCWYDILAGQIRFSSISADSKELPFRREIIITDSIADILAIAYNEYSDMYESTKYCSTSVDEALKVYVTKIKE